MKKKKIQKLGMSIILSSFLVGMTACSNVNNVSCQDPTCPYATEAQLNEIASLSNDFISYKVARTLGMLEMADFEAANNWTNNAVLSDTPVIIWESDSKPKYYEFHVIDNGNDVGYVTCNVNKKDGDPVAFISNSVKNYPPTSSRSVVSNTSKVYSANYPNVEILTSCRAASETDIDETEPSEEAAYKEWLESLTDEELRESGTTREEAFEIFLNDKKAEDERIEKLWSLIDAENEKLENLSDEEIIKVIKETHGESTDGISRSSLVTNSSGTDRTTKDYVFVEPYSSKTRVKSLDYCVPSVIEFVCQLYVRDNHLSITNAEITNAIKNSMGDKGMLFLLEDYKYKNALSNATGGRLTESSSIFHSFETITSNLYSNQLPVISCRSGGSTIFGLFQEGHCRAITGTCRVQNAVARQFLWIKWTDWEKKGYYYMWDNGYDQRNSPTTSEVNWGSYNNRENNHFWEKDGAWFYRGIKIVKEK